MDKNTINQLYSMKEYHNISFIDSIILYCEKSNIDIEDFGELLKKDKNFLETIKREALEESLLRKSDGWVVKSSLEDFF